MAKQILTQARLKELLHYDPDTGIFTWKVARAGRWVKVPGAIAGTKMARGYTAISVDGWRESCHRLAFLYMNGQLPSGDVDHINRNRTDNRWANLRDVSRSVNMQNRVKANKNSTSGFLGVSWSKTAKKFEACIKIDGKKKYLGLFEGAEEAHQAYLKAKRKYHEGNTL